MSRCPDQVVTLKSDPQGSSPQTSLVLIYQPFALPIVSPAYGGFIVDGYWKDYPNSKNKEREKSNRVKGKSPPTKTGNGVRHRSRLWKSFKTTGMCSRRHGGGRVRSTTPAEDRYIVLSAKRNRRTTAQQVANQFLAASGKQISRKTVARRLRAGGLYARRPVVCVSLPRQHRTARLQWCREHHNWTEQDWACVLFSDESRFSLSSDCRRQLIWRESGTAYRPENIQGKDRYPTCSIMVWAGIMINGRTHLHVIANGTMTCQRYIDEVCDESIRNFITNLLNRPFREI
ncbi:transposable element Tcb2 transposase [Trichonephila clavipes]|nr:transposable element Tcb2 transposase [Trichonephila clavipes]